MKIYYWLTTFLILLFIGGCAITQSNVSCNPDNPIKTLAVLPMQNDTSDIEGPKIVRKKMIEALIRNNYNIKPVEESDQILRDQFDITLGGQLQMANIEKLKEALDVEGLMFGTLLDFEEVITGIYNVRKVRAKFKIVNTTDQEPFWSNGIGVKNQDSSDDLAGSAVNIAESTGNNQDEIPWIIISNKNFNMGIVNNLIFGLGNKILAKTTNTYLVHETSEMIDRILTTIPTGPGIIITGETPATMQIKMPFIPPVGHLGYGDLDFKAVILFTATDLKGTKLSCFEMPFAKAGNKIRVELDFNQIQQNSQVSTILSKMVNINRGDKKLSYSLYPTKKRYIVHHTEEKDLKDNNFFEIPRIEKEKLGNEKIN